MDNPSWLWLGKDAITIVDEMSEMQLVGLEGGWSGPPAKKCRLLLGAGKHKGTDIPLEIPKRNSL